MGSSLDSPDQQSQGSCGWGRGEKEEVCCERRERRRRQGGLLKVLPFLVLDPPDGLNLGSLGVRAKLAITLVLSTTAVTLHDVLVAAVPGVLVAHKAIDIKEKVQIFKIQ